MRGAGGRRAGRRAGRAALVLLAVGLGAVVAGAVWLRTGYIVTVQAADSMSPTYRQGERIAAERIDGDEVRAGDVVLFADPRWFPNGELAMKRVVGTGGDRVTCCAGGRVSVDGEPLSEPYVMDGDPVGGTGPRFDVTVPEGRLFLLGDHRANSNDSRFRLSDGQSGTVSADAVRGRLLDGDSAAEPLLPLATALSGAILAVAGGILGAVALIGRRRAAG
ncbi:signal peptidase I [Streptomyces radiopugnans]|uniref:signal peptidase I n=1 Tax=Streptomyces radiopugnans TaxID=403935 RepID=UPI003F1BB8E1